MREADIQQSICSKLVNVDEHDHLFGEDPTNRVDLLNVIVNIEHFLRSYEDGMAIMGTFSEVEDIFQEREFNPRVLRDVHSLKLWQLNED
jgi:hypothetical protein